MPLAPKLTAEQFAALADNQKGAYVQLPDGTHRLDADDETIVGPLRRSLDTVKEERRTLAEQLRAAQEQLSGIDLEEYGKLKETQKKLEEKQLLEKGEVEELITRRSNEATQKMRKEFDTEKTTLTERASALEGSLTELLIDNALTAEAVELGVLPGGLRDVISRGKGVFKLNTKGKVAAFKPDGSEDFGRDGNPLTMKEYMTELRAGDGKHLFAANEGGGASNGAGNGTGPAAGSSLRRSQMTDKQKSDYIAEHGGDAYLALTP